MFIPEHEQLFKMMTLHFFSLIIISNRLGPGWGGDDYKSITSSNPGTHSPAPATRPARDAISLNNVEVTLRK